MFIFGFHSVVSQFKSYPQSIVEVFIDKNRFDKRSKEVFSLMQIHHITPHKTTKEKLATLVKNESHQGIVARITLNNIKNDNQLKEFIKKDLRLILILDNITDPRNIGACLRSANAFAVDCVIIAKDGCGAINEVAYKTSAGSINNLNIFQVVNISRTIKALQKQGVWVIGLDGTTQKTITEHTFNTPHALVMGSEGRGLRELTKKSCDEIVKIPMLGSVESLNVAVATGIGLFWANQSL